MNPVASFSQPLVFDPIYQKRLWGGRMLETHFGRELPDPNECYGESWEISDRPEAGSRVTSGPAELVGQTLGHLWRSPDRERREAIFGPGAPGTGPFPLLCKILDARDRLSLQVHPPAADAALHGGEPKTEIWVVAQAGPGAELFVGLRPGVTRARFEAALKDGTAEACVHRVPARVGDFLFVPSGRLHAIGSGLLIYEIQQNSDTTYRVFDWNRRDAEGQFRELHIEQSLRCIDFSDIAPGIGVARGPLLADCGHFRLERHQGRAIALPVDRPAIVTVVSGRVRLGRDETVFGEGRFFLAPARWAGDKRLVAADGAEATVLVTTW